MPPQMGLSFLPPDLRETHTRIGQQWHSQTALEGHSDTELCTPFWVTSWLLVLFLAFLPVFSMYPSTIYRPQGIDFKCLCTLSIQLLFESWRRKACGARWKKSLWTWVLGWRLSSALSSLPHQSNLIYWKCFLYFYFSLSILNAGQENNNVWLFLT